MQPSDGASAQLLQFFNGDPVKQSKTFKNAAHKFSRRLRRRLTRFQTKAGHFLWHLAGLQKSGLPRIDQGSKRLRPLRLLRQGGIVEFLALPSPFASRLLQNPEPNNIFQKPRGAAVSCLVSKVMLANL